MAELTLYFVLTSVDGKEWHFYGGLQLKFAKTQDEADQLLIDAKNEHPDWHCEIQALNDHILSAFGNFTQAYLPNAVELANADLDTQSRKLM